MSTEGIEPDLDRLREVVTALCAPPIGAYVRWTETGDSEAAERLEQWNELRREARALVGCCPTCGSEHPNHTEPIHYWRHGRDCGDPFHLEADGGL